MTDRTRPTPEPEPTRKRKVRLYVDEVDGQISYFAASVGGASSLAVTARGATADEAVANLRAAVEKKTALDRAREGYPKTIEVDW